MSGGKHTAGPWKVARNGLNTRVYEEGGKMICVVSSKSSPAPNARLIAAAPDLLAALSFALTDPCFSLLGSVTKDGIFAAIAKATGGQDG